MYRLSAVVALMLSPAPILAQETPVPISDVNVTVEIEAVDSNAMDRWPEIGPDLTAAILAAAAPYIAEDGRSVAVVLNEVRSRWDDRPWRGRRVQSPRRLGLHPGRSGGAAHLQRGNRIRG